MLNTEQRDTIEDKERTEERGITRKARRQQPVQCSRDGCAGASSTEEDHDAYLSVALTYLEDVNEQKGLIC